MEKANYFHISFVLNAFFLVSKRTTLLWVILHLQKGHTPFMKTLNALIQYHIRQSTHELASVMNSDQWTIVRHLSHDSDNNNHIPLTWQNSIVGWFILLILLILLPQTSTFFILCPTIFKEYPLTSILLCKLGLITTTNHQIPSGMKSKDYPNVSVI